MKHSDIHGGPTLKEDTPIRPITDKEFSLFQTLIHQTAGIYLCPIKKALLVGRLNKRLRELGLHTFSQYYALVKQGNKQELARLLDFISTNETQFFRQPRQFHFLQNEVFPKWSARAAAHQIPKKIRVWSTGCSTGQEPYSLAMVLLEDFPPSLGWNIEILASDLSTRVLESAQRALWPIDKAREIPDKYLKAYMMKGVNKQQGKMKAGSEIRSVVQFRRINLNEEPYPVTGLFDLIFCRNVLIYFDVETKSRIIQRLMDYLTPAGYLFIGQSESLNGITDRMKSIIPSVYTHTEPYKTVGPK